MNVLDVLLVLFAVAAAVGGYRLGFLARVASWVGLGLGVAVGSMVLPWVLRRLTEASDLTLAFVAISVLAGAALVGQAAGLVVGSRLHAALGRTSRLGVPTAELPAVRVPVGHGYGYGPSGGYGYDEPLRLDPPRPRTPPRTPHPTPLQRADKAAGALAGIVGLLIGLWLLLPTLGDVPGWTSEQARSSTIAREVTEWFPRAPDTIQALRRLVGDDPFPRVFDHLTPAPDPGPPPASTQMSEATAEQVAQSVVRVEGEACGRIQEGTGFFVGEGVIVTNAHVVAGEDDILVELASGQRAPASPVAFDPARDLAVLVTEAAAPPLPIGPSAVGAVGGVFGHPGGGPLEISPFEVADRITASGRDIYDGRSTERAVLVLAADLAPGDSGSALVDPDGVVVGVAFAVAPDRAGVAYALANTELRAVLSDDFSDVVDTGDCLV